MYFLFELTYGNKNRGEFIARLFIPSLCAIPGGVGAGNFPYWPIGKTPFERNTFFKLQVYEMVLAGISLAVEVHETELRGIFRSVI